MIRWVPDLSFSRLPYWTLYIVSWATFSYFLVFNIFFSPSFDTNTVTTEEEAVTIFPINQICSIIIFLFWLCCFRLLASCNILAYSLSTRHIWVIHNVFSVTVKSLPGAYCGESEGNGRVEDDCAKLDGEDWKTRGWTFRRKCWYLIFTRKTFKQIIFKVTAILLFLLQDNVEKNEFKYKELLGEYEVSFFIHQMSLILFILK